MIKKIKTYQQKQAEVKRNWHLIDAKGQILGRIAQRIAQILIGKHKPTFTPHIDGGDYVVVINASEIKVTGKKLSDKIYYRHSGYPGGLKSESLQKLLERRPSAVIERAVYGMLPKNKHRNIRIKRLKVYAGNQHPHQANIASK